MEDTEERKKRDVRAIRWLVDKAAVNAEMEPFILAIPGTINTEWGREVWINVASEGRSDPYTLETRTDRSDVNVRSLSCTTPHVPSKGPPPTPSADAYATFSKSARITLISNQRTQDVGAYAHASRPRHHSYAVLIFNGTGSEMLAS
jgi:hypothetical protein